MSLSSAYEYSNIVNDVNLILSNAAFDISAPLNIIASTYATNICGNHFRYIGGCVQYVVQYLTTQEGGKLPETTRSIVGPDREYEKFSMKHLYTYYEAYNNLLGTSVKHNSYFLLRVKQFIDAYANVKRYFGLFAPAGCDGTQV